MLRIKQGVFNYKGKSYKKDDIIQTKEMQKQEAEKWVEKFPTVVELVEQKRDRPDSKPDDKPDGKLKTKV